MKLIIYNLGFAFIIYLKLLFLTNNEFNCLEKFEKFSSELEKTDLKSSTKNSKKYKSERKSNNKKNIKNTLQEKYTSSNNNQNSSSNSSNSLLNSMYRSLNDTIVAKDLHEFKRENRKFDFKILDKELEEIFHLMLLRNNKRLTTNSVRDFIHFFMNSYNNCDKDKDNILDLSEFINCLKSDKYLVQIIPIDPRKSNSTFSPLYKKYDPEEFYKLVFESLDEKEFGYLNFNDYMKLRLIAFSWRKCSVFAPYLEETDFECSIEIVAGYKTLSRTLVRKIFFLALELSNSNGNRAVDFLTFINIAGSIKIYSKINTKQDDDITRNEFNSALDGNTIPIRYNQHIINQMFELMQEADKPNQGIDLQSFIFYDFFLKLFYKAGKSRLFLINRDEFYQILKNPLFPNTTLHEIYLIPQYEFNADSYQVYQYYNISRFNSEENYLYKSFLELENSSNSKSANENKNNIKTNLRLSTQVTNKEKNRFVKSEKKVAFGSSLQSQTKLTSTNSNKKTSLNSKEKSTELKYRTEYEKSETNAFNTLKSLNKNIWSDFDLELFTSKVSNRLNLPGLNDGKNAFNVTVDLNKTVDKIFNGLDIDFDGYADFKDFAYFIHVTYLFSKEDKYNRGKIAAGNLYEIYTNYADYPVIGWKTRESAKKFSFFDTNLFVDALDAYLILNIDSVARYFYRLGDTQTLNEIEAKKFLTRINMRYIPDVYLNKCLRGIDSNNLPKYEWECCFIQGMNLNLKFYETMDNYMTVKANNLTLSNTVFYNVDPNYL